MQSNSWNRTKIPSSQTTEFYQQFLKVLAYFLMLWYIINTNCGGRLRTTPWKSLMRRVLFLFFIRLVFFSKLTLSEQARYMDPSFFDTKCKKRPFAGRPREIGRNQQSAKAVAAEASLFTGYSGTFFSVFPAFRVLFGMFSSKMIQAHWHDAGTDIIQAHCHGAEALSKRAGTPRRRGAAAVSTS